MEIVMQFSCGIDTLTKYPQQVVAAPTCTKFTDPVIVSGVSGDTRHGALCYSKTCLFDYLFVGHAISIQFLLAIFTLVLKYKIEFYKHGTKTFCYYNETQGEVVYLLFDNSPYSATSVVILDLQHQMAPGSIIWGLQYNGPAEGSLRGRYIYAYNNAFWSAAMESQPNGRYTLTQIAAACSKTTPIPCQDSPVVISFAEDDNKEGIILATDGVYKIVAYSLCASGPLGLGPGPAPTHRRRSRGKTVAAVLGSLLGAMGTTLLAWVIWKWKKMQEDKDSACPISISIECSCCNKITCIWCCS